MDVATLLRRCRRAAGLSQRDLAARAGTSAAAICQYENGTRVPQTDTLVRLVAATGATLTWSARMTPEPVDVVRNGRILEQVLDLADELPHRRPSEQIAGPVFARLAA